MYGVSRPSVRPYVCMYVVCMYVCMCVCVYISLSLCNELIEETARRRKLIFGMWESFGYGSSKY